MRNVQRRLLTVICAIILCIPNTSMNVSAYDVISDNDLAMEENLVIEEVVSDEEESVESIDESLEGVSDEEEPIDYSEETLEYEDSVMVDSSITEFLIDETPVMVGSEDNIGDDWDDSLIAEVSNEEEFVIAINDNAIRTIKVIDDFSLFGKSYSVAGASKEIDGQGHTISIDKTVDFKMPDFVVIRNASFISNQVSFTFENGGELSGIKGSINIVDEGTFNISDCEISDVIIRDGDNSLLKDSVIFGSVYIHSSYRCQIDNCQIESETGTAVFIGKGTGPVSCDITNTSIAGGQYGLWADLYREKITVSNSTITGKVNGIYNDGTSGGGTIFFDDVIVRSEDSYGLNTRQGTFHVKSGKFLQLDTNGKTGIGLFDSGRLYLEEGCMLDHVDNCYTLYAESTAFLSDEAELLNKVVEGTNSSLYLLKSKDENSIDKITAEVGTEEEFETAIRDESIQIVKLIDDFTISKMNDSSASVTKEIDGQGHTVTIDKPLRLVLQDFTTIQNINIASSQVSLTFDNGGELNAVKGNVNVVDNGLLHISDCEITGVVIRDGDGSLLKDSGIYGSVYIHSSSGCLIDNCEIESKTDTAVFIGKGSGAVSCDITNTIITGGQYGLWTDLYRDKITVSNSMIEGKVNGIFNDGTNGGGTIFLEDVLVKSTESYGLNTRRGTYCVKAGKYLQLATNGKAGIGILDSGRLNLEDGCVLEHMDNNYTLYLDSTSVLSDEEGLLDKVMESTNGSVYFLKSKDLSALEKVTAEVSTESEFKEAISDESVQLIKFIDDFTIMATTYSVAGVMKEIDGQGHTVTIGKPLGVEVKDFATLRNINFTSNLVKFNFKNGGELDAVKGNVNVNDDGLLHISDCEITGVVIRDGDGSILKDSRINGSVYIHSSYGCLIDNCQIESGTGTAVFIGKGSGPVRCDIVNSIIFGEEYGLRANLYGEEITVSDSTITGKINGIYNDGTFGGGNICLENVVVKSSDSYGIVVTGNGGIKIPDNKNLELDTINNIGINICKKSFLTIGHEVSIKFDSHEYFALKQVNAKCSADKSLLTAFEKANISSIGYCLTEKVEATFNWAKDYSSCEIQLSCKDFPEHRTSYSADVTKTIIREATCLENGTTRYIAQYSVFKDTKDINDIEKVEHVWSEEYSTDKEPTCAIDGEKSIHCIKCNAIKAGSVTIVPALGHDWDEGVIVDEASIEREGKIKYTCLRCREERFQLIPLCTPTPKPESISEFTCEITPLSYTYNGSERKPNVTVKNGNSVLISEKDYTVAYKNNIDSGTAEVLVTGKGRYTGTVIKEFTIQKADAYLSFEENIVLKTTLEKTFINMLTKKTDGIVTFRSNNTKVITVDKNSGIVTIKGKGTAVIMASASEGKNYKPENAAYAVMVNAVSVENASVAGVSLSYGYSGKEYVPPLTVTVNGLELTKDTDYKAVYENNMYPGIATITITGIGKYTGKRTKTFEIVDCVSEVTSGHTYQLIPKNNSSTAVCAFAGRMVNNTKVYITNRSNSEAMRFKAVRNADGTWKFMDAKCELALAVRQNSMELGTGVVLYEPTSKKAQNWRVEKKSDNSFALINDVTGYSIAMSDETAVKGTTLNMAETASNGLQRFYFVEADSVDASYTGIYTIRASKNRNYSIDVTAASNEDGANVQLYTYNGTKAQKFRAVYSGDSYYRLVNVNSGLVLTVNGNTKANRTNVIQSKWAGQSGQRWTFIENKDGTVTLKNVLGTVLHLNGNVIANGTNVLASSATASTAQRWYLQ